MLLDFMLPKLNGMEVCRRLQANPDTRSIIVVVLTANARARIEVGTFSIAAWISKPFSTRDLMRTITLLLGDQPPA